ncbi:MAG: hypothetical protein V1871_01155 [Planctomycetota bacterium]
MRTNRLKIKLGGLVVNGFLMALAIFFLFSILSCEQKKQKPTLPEAVEGKPSEVIIPKAVEDKPSEIVLADFEKSLPEGFKAVNVEAGLECSQEESVIGRRFLKVFVPLERKSVSQLSFKLSKTVDLSDYYSLALSVLATPKSEAWKFRWYAVDEKGKQLFQRVFTLDKDSIWTSLDFPLYLWRWDNNYAGDWAEVTTFVLNIEKGESELYIDDIKLTRATHNMSWLASFAFPAGKNRILLEDGFLLATDAFEELSDDDLKTLLEKVRPIRAWIHSIFKKASRPFGGDSPVSLLIFRNTDDFQEFYKKLGLAWGVNINPPKAGGYTVQDIAASTYNEKLGINRPVYFHELVHALVARELRILPGNPRYNWLQEGIANYLQVCLYPESLRQESFINNFSKPISRDGKSFFKPLEHLLTKPISMDNYAQLASFVLFLVERHPDYLDHIGLNLADGKEISQVLSDLGTSFDKLEEEYIFWGKQTFVPDSEHPLNADPSEQAGRMEGGQAAGKDTAFTIPEQWQKSRK